MDPTTYKPDFNLPEKWTKRDRRYLAPFATNMDGLVTCLRNLPPELAGALSSRASRAENYLLRVFLNEYIYPILKGADKELAHELKWTINFLNKHGSRSALNTARAQKFFIKWLAAYGDESIAQMMGTYLVFWGISQVAIKFFEDSRMGIAPLEKSTRFVDFGKKVCGKYLYYTDPDIIRCGLGAEYQSTNDFLFKTYTKVVALLKEWIFAKFPEEERSVLGKKALDVARGFLPMSTLGQVVFYGNGQAFEYMLNKSIEHELGEIRWAAQASRDELDKEIYSILLRLDEAKSWDYQKYLASKRGRVSLEMEKLQEEGKFLSLISQESETSVRLVDFDPDGEAKVVAAILFPSAHLSWTELVSTARQMSSFEKERIIATYLEGRGARWQKVGRAFERIYVMYEILMNIGAYRDLHRHRMLTQERQLFSVNHGYDVPVELQEAGLADYVHRAAEKVEKLYKAILDRLGETHAQYATMLFHRVRFYQWENLREFFWEAELRTGSQGHPDYRKIEQEKYRLLRKVYPIITDPKFMFVDMNDYDFARRGLEEKTKRKEEKLIEQIKKRDV